MEKTDTQFISAIASGEMMSRYLDGYAMERHDELEEHEIKHPLTKSYLLESARDTEKVGSISAIMNRNHIRLEAIDERLYRVFDQLRSEYMGFLEVTPPRYFIFYTMRRSDESDPWIRKITRIRELDHIWLSNSAFQVLLHKIAQLHKPHRYVKIGFRRDNIYQIEQDNFPMEEATGVTSSVADGAGWPEKMLVDERKSPKRPLTNFTMLEPLIVIQEKMMELQEIFTPQTINLLRFPSTLERGGHDFYDNGKVTNRSGNFEDHRNHLLYVLRFYNHLLNYTEEIIWNSSEKETVTMPGVSQKLVGAPVLVKFSRPLGAETFEYWLTTTFDRMNNRFRLWGNPVRLDSQKVHVYVVDQHLWQPFFLEITAGHLTAIIPAGTCGNTIQRLITNIQRYLDPMVEVFIGNNRYEDLVAQSIQGIVYERLGCVLQ
jgi:hypothetical protein